jgi:hypothetical protein
LLRAAPQRHRPREVFVGARGATFVDLNAERILGSGQSHFENRFFLHNHIVLKSLAKVRQFLNG